MMAVLSSELSVASYRPGRARPPERTLTGKFIVSLYVRPRT